MNYWLFFSQATPTLLIFTIESSRLLLRRLKPCQEVRKLYFTTKYPLVAKSQICSSFPFFNVWNEKSKIDGKLSLWRMKFFCDRKLTLQQALGSFTSISMKLFSLWSYIVVGLGPWPSQLNVLLSCFVIEKRHIFF